MQQRAEFAVFMSIDTDTGLPPDVLTGFLPPEDGTGRGMGHFSYVIRAKTGLSTGTRIHNVAEINFDFAETIATNQIDPHDASQGTDPAKEAFVTIDAASPSSRVDPLPAESGPMLTLSWTGADDPGGSGIAAYDVFASMDGGVYVKLIENVKGTSAAVTLEPGHSYDFYTIAVDHVGHTELPPPVADAHASVVSTDAIPPTVDITDVIPHSRQDAVEQILITFSEPVLGFDLTDLTLTHRLDEPANVILTGAMLTSLDSQTWYLQNLSEATVDSGNYDLRVLHQDTGITDLSGNRLAAGTSEFWIVRAGDANGDRLFNSSDLVFVFQRGEYEDHTSGNSIWSDGDWNGDGEFDSSDLVAAFQTGLYERQSPVVPISIFDDDLSEIADTEGPDPMLPELIDAFFALGNTLKKRSAFVA